MKGEKNIFFFFGKDNEIILENGNENKKNKTKEKQLDR